MDSALIRRNVEAVIERIEIACDESGRRRDEVKLLAVVKTRTLEEAQAVIDAGIGMVGENRVQEAQARREFLTGDFEYHMIGHLQTNKAGTAAAMFDVVQSVDSYRLAGMLSEEAGKRGRELKVYLQVNSSGEESKSGFEPGEVLGEADRIAELPNLKLCGLMTIGPLTDDEDEIRRAFSMTRGIFDKLRGTHPGVSELSMGMTDDIEIAVSEGSTMLRVGRALFGGR